MRSARQILPPLLINHSHARHVPSLKASHHFHISSCRHFTSERHPSSSPRPALLPPPAHWVYSQPRSSSTSSDRGSRTARRILQLAGRLDGQPVPGDVRGETHRRTWGAAMEASAPTWRHRQVHNGSRNVKKGSYRGVTELVIREQFGSHLYRAQCRAQSGRVGRPQVREGQEIHILPG